MVFIKLKKTIVLFVSTTVLKNHCRLLKPDKYRIDDFNDILEDILLLPVTILLYHKNVSLQEKSYEFVRF